MKTINFIVAVILSSLIFTSYVHSLYHNDNSIIYTDYDPSEKDCYNDVEFNAHVKEILNQSCMLGGCHVQGGPMKGDFSSYESIMAYIRSGDRIEERIIRTKDMPPVYSPGPVQLSEEDIQMIWCWIKQGYKE